MSYYLTIPLRYLTDCFGSCGIILFGVILAGAILAIVYPCMRNNMENSQNSNSSKVSSLCFLRFFLILCIISVCFEIKLAVEIMSSRYEMMPLFTYSTKKTGNIYIFNRKRQILYEIEPMKLKNDNDYKEAGIVCENLYKSNSSIHFHLNDGNLVGYTQNNGQDRKIVIHVNREKSKLSFDCTQNEKHNLREVQLFQVTDAYLDKYSLIETEEFSIKPLIAETPQKDWLENLTHTKFKNPTEKEQDEKCWRIASLISIFCMMISVFLFLARKQAGETNYCTQVALVLLLTLKVVVNMTILSFDVSISTKLVANAAYVLIPMIIPILMTNDKNQQN